MTHFCFNLMRCGRVGLVSVSLFASHYSVVASDPTPRLAGDHRMLAVQRAASDKEPKTSDVAMPNLHITSVRGPTPINFEISDNLTPKPAFEVSPILVGESFFATTGWSWLCRRGSNVLAEGGYLGKDNCARFSVPIRINRQTGENVSPEQARDGDEHWRRSYSGVLSAQILNPTWHGYNLVAAMHGENKNEKIGSALYANTVSPSVTPESCSSGFQNGTYNECWPAYYGFISLAFAYIEKGNASGPMLDTGPIIWPSMGYLDKGKKTSDGVRHPYTIESNGYLYLFYQDTSHGSEPGRRGGFEVARLKLRGASPSKLTAVPYFNGDFADDNPSLPAGFKQGKIWQFYEERGGRASELWPNSWQALRFSVAKLEGTTYFIGVEEYAGKNEWGVRLRLSPDLAHWSDPRPIPGLTSTEGWTAGVLHYPGFSDVRGTKMDSVDPKDFYLIGSDSKGSVVSDRLSISLTWDH